MSKESLEKMKEELHRLMENDRIDIRREIAIAAAKGDLKENSEYSSAKEKQRLIEKKIDELEYKINNAYIIQMDNINTKAIAFGATVELLDINTNKIVKYKLVGADEADILNGSLSISSPLAKKLLNKKSEDTIEQDTPNGTKEYKIVSFNYD